MRSFDEYWVGITSRTVTLMTPLPILGNNTEVTRSYTTVNTTGSPEVTSAISTTDFVPSTTNEFQLNQNYSNEITSPDDNLETTTAQQETRVIHLTTDSSIDTTLCKTSLSTPVDVSIPSPETTISEVTTIESTTVTQTTNKPRISTESSTPSVTVSLLDTTPLKISSSTLVGVSTPIEVSTSLQETTINGVTDDLILSTTAQSPTTNLPFKSTTSDFTTEPRTQTNPGTTSVTDSPLDTTLLKTSLLTPVNVATSAEVLTPSQETTISEVTDDFMSTISSTTVQSPINKSTTESQLNTTITTDLSVTETTTKPLISTDAGTPLITNDRTTPTSEDNTQTEGPTFQSATNVYSTNEITDNTSAETSASTILPDNAFTTLSVDTSATQNISTPPSTTQPVHATTVSLSDKSTPLIQPVDSSTTREVKVSATPQVTPSQTQSYVDSNTDINDSSESPTTNSAETSPVAKSTAPRQPLTEEVTQIITVDGAEVIELSSGITSMTTVPTKAPTIVTTTERVRATTGMTAAYFVRGKDIGPLNRYYIFKMVKLFNI